jgi:hypothetical protein
VNGSARLTAIRPDGSAALSGAGGERARKPEDIASSCGVAASGGKPSSSNGWVGFAAYPLAPMDQSMGGQRLIFHDQQGVVCHAQEVRS